MHLKRMICAGAAVFGVMGTAAVADASASIKEAGSSLVYPLASSWSRYYTGTSFSAAAGGSSAGIADAANPSKSGIDIGASDAPETPTQYAANSGDVVQIPWALSATGVGYNVKGVKGTLHLNAKVLAGIFTGKITTWGNSAITKLNKSNAKALKRAGKITPVFRSDGSGDSYAFQHFLTVGAGKAWPYSYATSWGAATVGVGENGNAGVAGEVKKNPGSIGYISAYYLIQQHISAAAIENAAGKFEVPNAANILAAAKSNSTITAQGPNFTGISIVYPPKKFKTAYPISTFTYAIVNKSDPNLSDVKAFLTWAISKQGGQKYGGPLDFVALPAGVVNADTQLINSL